MKNKMRMKLMAIVLALTVLGGCGMMNKTVVTERGQVVPDMYNHVRQATIIAVNMRHTALALSNILWQNGVIDHEHVAVIGKLDAQIAPLLIELGDNLEKWYVYIDNGTSVDEIQKMSVDTLIALTIHSNKLTDYINSILRDKDVDLTVLNLFIRTLNEYVVMGGLK